MSELVFNEILLISQKEKKARKVEFDPRLTIILRRKGGRVYKFQI